MNKSELNTENVPMFFSPLINSILALGGSILSIIAFVFPKLSENDGIKISLNILIGIAIVLFIIFIFVIKYILNIKKINNTYCEKYGILKSNRDKILTDNEKYIEKNRRLKKELEISEGILKDMLTFLDATSLEPNEYEKKCINNLIQNLYTKLSNIKRNGE